jgi:hypothetical protein
MFRVPYINQMYKICKRPTNAHGCMNVILLHNNHQNVLTTDVAILMVVRKRVQYKLYVFLNVECFWNIIIVLVFLFLSRWGWLPEWPEHVCDYCVIKLHSYIQVYLLLFLKTFIQIPFCCVVFCSFLYMWILIIHRKIKTGWGYWRIGWWREYLQVREGSDRKLGIFVSKCY